MGGDLVGFLFLIGSMVIVALWVGSGFAVISTELCDERSKKTAFTYVVGYVRINRHGAHALPWVIYAPLMWSENR